MRVYIKLNLIALAAMMLFSCANENILPPNNDPNAATYSQLGVGNYWIYEKFATDSNGNDYSLNSFDSVYIESDTLINGEAYFKMIEPVSYINTPTPYQIPKTVTFLKDSLNYIVNSKHQIVFSSNDFNNILLTYYTFSPQIPQGDTQSVITCRMVDNNFVKSTPAGLFTTINYQREFIQRAPFDTILGDTIHFNTRYAENVGIVSKSLPVVWFQTTRVERRLVRYHLN